MTRIAFIRTKWLAGILIVATGFVSACGLPHDAEGTLPRVQNGVMRVGISADSPWVVQAGGSVSGYEAQIVTQLAAQLHSRIETHAGSESELLEKLHKQNLDIVIGGLTDDSPWKKSLALTRPYHEDREGKKHVLALPPGENAWLLTVERYLRDNEERLKAIPE
ncbi:MAG TPA: transporter substrate-binding domain-containing protein [Gemmatimonadaceae bacterium]